jgi:hypothetical protein
MKLDYAHCLEIVKSQKARGYETKKIANNTYLRLESDGNLRVKYHNTDIITVYPDNSCKVTIDGWNTVSTRSRLNDLLPGHGFYTRKGTLYYKDTVFFEGMTISSDGQILNLDSEMNNADEILAKEKKLAKLVTKYVNGYAAEYMKKVQAIELRPRDENGYEMNFNERVGKSISSAGDCFLCKFGPIKSSDLGHVYSHLEEQYYVSIFLYRAVEFLGFPSPRLIVSVMYREAYEGKTAWLKRELRSFFRKNKNQLLNHVVLEPCNE